MAEAEKIPVYTPSNYEIRSTALNYASLAVGGGTGARNIVEAAAEIEDYILNGAAKAEE